MAAALTLAAAPSMAQSDWRQIAYDSGVNVAFFYSPGSVQRNGDFATANWHDSRNPGLIFLAQANCSARTLQNLSVDEYDADGAFKQRVDLSGQSTPQQLGPPGTFGYNLVQSIC
jgi:hypothetical protein